MTRSKWWLSAPSALALLVVGCAHCDTCDDFPRSYSSKYLRGSYTQTASVGAALTGTVVSRDRSTLSAMPVVTTVPTTSTTQMNVPLVTPPPSSTLSQSRGAVSQPRAINDQVTPPIDRPPTLPPVDPTPVPRTPVEPKTSVSPLPEAAPTLPEEPPLSPPPGGNPFLPDTNDQAPAENPFLPERTDKV